MHAKKIFFSLLLILLVSIAQAGNVYIDYVTVGLYSNHVSKVNVHDDFVFHVNLPEGAVVTRISYSKTSPQSKNKNRFLGVGINEYENKKYAPDNKCSYDARYISLQNYYNRGGASLLTNNFAIKDTIRQKLSDIASELESGDSLLFYYAGRAENGSSLLTYDAEYPVSEFTDDLAKFASGVKIVIILDAVDIDKFLNTLPAEITTSPDIVIIACTRNDVKKAKRNLGPFMTAWYESSLKYLTDFNKDKYLSFYEMAKRAEYYLKAKKSKENFYFQNETLALELCYANAQSSECYGDIEIDYDKRTFTFTMPDIDGDASMTVEAPKSYYEDLAVYPKQSTFKVNLKKPPYVTKFTFDFESDFPIADGLPQTFSMLLNKVYIPIVGEVKMKKDGKAGTFSLQDRDFKNIGTLKFQCINGRYFYKLKLTDKETLSEVLEKSSGTEIVELMVRHSWHIGPPCKLIYDKKYKDGKSLSAKLQPQE